jgi:acetylornithine deacetylase
MIKQERIKDLLIHLIDMYSPTGKEGEIGSYLLRYLKKHGIPAFLQNVEDHRNNVVYIPEKAPELLFVGHIDTVPAPDFDHYEAEVDEDIIRGLGTADMKSGCAAIIEAFIAFTEQHGTEVPAALALVVGEEETGDGIIRYLEEYHQPWALVAEPTDLIPCLGHYGYIETQLETRGTRMHASLATKEHNAIHNLLLLLLSLTGEMDRSKQDIAYNIRDMMSTQAGFTVPDRCNASVDFHLPPHYPIGDMLIELEELVAKTLPEYSMDTPLIQFSTIHSGYLLPDKGFLPQRIRNIYEANRKPYAPDFFRSDSDASLLWESGIRPVILGPGTLNDAHTAEESVPFSQVLEAADIYLKLLESLTH